MWHSQTKVWYLMENAASGIQHQHAKAATLGGGNHFRQPSYYSRVANYYFHDNQNSHAVTPAYSSLQVNDWMIYGPYAADKIWGTKNWDRYHHHVLKVLPTHAAESFGLHDKRLVAHTVIPDIRTETGMEVMKDQILYFLRVHANKYIWMGDSPNDRKSAVEAKLEELHKVNCREPF